MGELPVTEERHPDSAHLDILSTEDVIRLVVEDAVVGAQKTLLAVKSIAPIVDAGVHCLRRGGSILYVGAGTSGRLGVLDASECPPTFGTDPTQVRGIIAGGKQALVRSIEGAEDDEQAGSLAIDHKKVGDLDLVIGIASSGRTPFVLSALSRARELGAVTAGIAFVREPDLQRVSDHLVSFSVGPEILAGSTRLKAGTATKIILNAITTGVMVRSGKVYSNLMVDLEPRCHKLVQRAIRIVCAIADVSQEEARALLEASGNSVKVAIVMHHCGVSREEAVRRLSEEEGFLRRVLEPALSEGGE